MMTTEFENAVYWLKKHGFKGEYGYDGWYGTNGLIRVGLFTEDAPENYTNKLMMETERTFNKWSQAYYVREIPRNDYTWKVVENDMVAIQQSFHVKRANEFESYFPIEAWETSR